MRAFVFLLVMLACCGNQHAFGATIERDWLPVTRQDLQYREVSADPGASAVLLYYADDIIYVSDYDQTEFIYRRIKILTDAGKSYANVEIPQLPWVKIQDLETRSISPDGRITDFATAPFDKVIVKSRNFKYMAKAFSFSDVAPGTIIEYKYKLHSSWTYCNQWILQHGLFAVRESFSFKHAGPWTMSFVVSGSDSKPVKSKDTYELELTSVPAFHPEDQMPPEENYKAAVRFFYSTKSNLPTKDFWTQQARRWSLSINNFIGNSRDVERESASAIGNATTDQEKLRRLYARAQQIRNLSYERERTQAEDKKEHIKENNSAADVLKHGYGTGFDINALFVAMARATGFDAYFVLVAGRGSRFFELAYLDGDQFNGSMAAVTLNKKSVLFDPGTNFCPFGLIHWTHSATEGLEIGKNNWFYLTLPTTAKDDAELFRNARGTLSEDGTLKAEVSLSFQGMEAMERRLLGLQSDEAGRDKMMVDELMQWLPPQSSAHVTGSMGWNRTDSPLVINFEVEIPAYAATAGKRLLVPANLFPTRQKATFEHSTRKYPVYFAYPFSEFDLTVIQIPRGYTVESVPSAVEKKMPFGQYTSGSKSAGNQIITNRSLVLDGFLYEPDKYAELKGLFDTVVDGDGSQVVFRSASGALSQASSASTH
jgi:hypothetical protein